MHTVSDKKIFKTIFSINAYLKIKWPRCGPLMTQEQHLNNISRGPQDDAQWQKSYFYSLQYYKRRFSKIRYFTKIGPTGIIDPRDIIWKKIEAVHNTMEHTKELGSMAYCSSQEDILRFFFIQVYVKSSYPVVKPCMTLDA